MQTVAQSYPAIFARNNSNVKWNCKLMSLNMKTLTFSNVKYQDAIIDTNKLVNLRAIQERDTPNITKPPT